MRDKHPNQQHMKVSVRSERGVEMQREFMGIGNELRGGRPCSRVTLTEGANAKVPYTHWCWSNTNFLSTYAQHQCKSRAYEEESLLRFTEGNQSLPHGDKVVPLSLC